MRPLAALLLLAALESVQAQPPRSSTSFGVSITIVAPPAPHTGRLELELTGGDASFATLTQDHLPEAKTLLVALAQPDPACASRAPPMTSDFGLVLVLPASPAPAPALESTACLRYAPTPITVRRGTRTQQVQAFDQMYTLRTRFMDTPSSK